MGKLGTDLRLFSWQVAATETCQTGGNLRGLDPATLGGGMARLEKTMQRLLAT